jgi:hypothetical protein
VGIIFLHANLCLTIHIKSLFFYQYSRTCRYLEKDYFASLLDLRPGLLTMTTSINFLNTLFLPQCSAYKNFQKSNNVKFDYIYSNNKISIHTRSNVYHMKIYIRMNLIVFLWYSRCWYFLCIIGQTSNHLIFFKKIIHTIFWKLGSINFCVIIYEQHFLRALTFCNLQNAKWNIYWSCKTQCIQLMRTPQGKEWK